MLVLNLTTRPTQQLTSIGTHLLPTHESYNIVVKKTCKPITMLDLQCL